LVKQRTLKQMEIDHINEVMTSVDGNISAGARILGLCRRSLQRKLAKLGRWRNEANERRETVSSAPEQNVVLDHVQAAWLGSHRYWPVKERIDWRRQPWSHEMRDLIEYYEREARDFAKQT
jgi:hypothetical protein